MPEQNDKFADPNTAVSVFQVGRHGKHVGYFVAAKSPEDALELVRQEGNKKLPEDVKIIRILSLKEPVTRGILRF